MRPLIVVLAIVVIGVSVARCSTSSSTSSTPAPTHAATRVAPTTPPKPEWIYDAYEDKMTGVTGRYATLESTNTADLDFPYQGPQHATIQVGDDDGVIFRVEKGQLNCTPGCYALVKLDDTKAISYAFYGLSDKNVSMGTADHTLGKRLHAAKHMTMRVTFFQNGTFDFEFETAGLKPFPKAGKKKA